MKAKEIVKKCLCLASFLPFYNRICLGRRGGNRLRLKDTRLVNCQIWCKGKDNEIVFDGGYMKNTKITVNGDHNKIYVGSGCTIIDGDFCIEDSGNIIRIGKGTSLCGKCHLACIEGTAITIGERCLLSSEIVFRTGDSHSIIDEYGQRTNYSKDIFIADHVWIGHRVLINKGSFVPENCVVGTGSIVTKKFDEVGCALAGNPAKIIKRKISWDDRRI